MNVKDLQANKDLTDTAKGQLLCGCNASCCDAYYESYLLPLLGLAA